MRSVDGRKATMQPRSALLGVLLLVSGCFVSLSRPRGEAHLLALAEAGRDLHHGRLCESAERYKNAADAAERRVDRDEALYRYAKTLLRCMEQSQPEQDHEAELRLALAALDEIATKLPVSRRTARASLDAGLALLKHGHQVEGIARLRQMVVRFPETSLASRALYWIMRDEKEKSGAAGVIARSDELLGSLLLSSVGDDLLMFKARAQLELGESAAGQEALERLIRFHPYPEGERWDDALWLLADLAEERGDFAAVVERMQQILAVHESTTNPGSYTLPRMPEAAVRLAKTLQSSLHDRPAAREAWEDLYDDFPYSTFRDDALLALAQMDFEDGAATKGCERLRMIATEFEAGRARREAVRLMEQNCQSR